MYRKTTVFFTFVVGTGGKGEDLRIFVEGVIGFVNGNESHLFAKMNEILIGNKICFKIVIVSIRHVRREGLVHENAFLGGDFDGGAVKGRSVCKVVNGGEHASVFHIVSVDNGVFVFRNVGGVSLIDEKRTAGKVFSVEISSQVVVLGFVPNNGVIDYRTADGDPACGIGIDIFQLMDLSNQIFPSLDEGTQYFSSVYHSLRPPLPMLSTLAWSWPSTSVC